MSKKLFVTLFLLSLSTEIFSETYICSHELSKFNKPGEVETMRFDRKGSIFMGGIVDSNSYPYQIQLESESNLILVNISTHNPPSLFTVFIDKGTKEWGMEYVSIEELKKEEIPSSYGKCVIVN